MFLLVGVIKSGEANAYNKQNTGAQKTTANWINVLINRGKICCCEQKLHSMYVICQIGMKRSYTHLSDCLFSKRHIITLKERRKWNLYYSDIDWVCTTDGNYGLQSQRWRKETEIKLEDMSRGFRDRRGDLPAEPPGALLAEDRSPGSPCKSTAGTPVWGRGERELCISTVVWGLYHVGPDVQTWLATINFSTNLSLVRNIRESCRAWQLQQPLAKPLQDHWMAFLSVSGNTKALWTVITL